jgi:glycosyltransferase involved in cell wall biosynthesis
MSAPRLLHVFSTFNLGGPQARAVQLINAWGPDYKHMIVSVEHAELAARDRLQIEASFPAFPDLKRGSLPGRLLAVRSRIAQLKPDLVLTYNWGAVEVVMARRVFGGAPIVHHEDGFGTEESESLYRRRTWFRRQAFGAAHQIIVPSRVLERIARDTWRQPAARVTYIPNGVDLPAFSIKPQASAIPGFVADNRLVVGTVAGLREEKNLTRLVRAFAAAARDLPARLVIVGEGPDRDAIVAEARAQGLADRVHLPGFMSNPERYVGLFDVFALSSDTEQFPISLVEAMAASLPAASTAVGDIRDIVTPDNLPFVTPPRDEAALAAAIRALLVDPDLRRRIGTANRARVEREFSLTAMIARYKQIYDGALTDGRERK